MECFGGFGREMVPILVDIFNNDVFNTFNSQIRPSTSLKFWRCERPYFVRNNSAELLLNGLTE